MAKMAETVLSEDLILEQLESSMARGINIVATEENLFAIHSKIQKHLKNEKALTKTDILKLVTFLDKMECSGERLTVISQYAEQVLFNILVKQSQESCSQLATTSSTVTQNLDHANDDGTPKSNTFEQVFRTESNLFPTQSSDTNSCAAEASRNYNYTEPVQNEDVSINSYNLNPSAMLVLNLDGNNEVSDNTIYLPSQLLTNNNFVEDTTRAQNSQNKDVTEQDKFSSPELIEFENGNTIDNDDLTEIHTFTLNNVYDSTETFKASQEIISNSMRIINRKSSEASEESIVFDINPETTTTGIVNDKVTNDIKELSDKMKTSIVLNDSEDIIHETPLIIDETPLITDETPLIIDETPLIIDEIPLIIDETPSVSISPQTRTRSYTQSKSFLNFYKSSPSRSNICKRRKVKKFEKTSIFKNVMGKSNIEMMPGSQTISELSSDPKDITPPGNELINSSTISSDQTINSSSTGSSRSNLSLNRVVINGSEVTNEQASAQRNNEAIQAEKELKMVKEQRNKYREKWDTMSVKEKVNAKFVKKFQINIFEDPVDSLLNIDYETNPNSFYYKRVTKDEMNEILKSHNIEFLTRNLKESIRDAFTDTAAKANKENMEKYYYDLFRLQFFG
ncbi:uncharacterized protein LOC115875614 isoform X2 [Sitophilus oryzae]|uniref:Uncharacterized protein LOC115875614 isoform X2 n=1 Tax=Sitophilus oryzae TaxID=7048 RepID=A0A6J2X8C5_SITOR|nr:uncharacterized protein LOC115875614 isoform X2 [Sitophilus oryzae]